MDKRKIGSVKEEAACAYLRNCGMNIIERNFFSRHGEIDIIGIKDRYLCFVEVKYRKNTTSGFAVEAVNSTKQLKICKTAQYFLLRHRQYRDYQIRFDVIAIDGEKITYYENAFDFIGQGAY